MGRFRYAADIITLFGAGDVGDRLASVMDKENFEGVFCNFCSQTVHESRHESTLRATGLHSCYNCHEKQANIKNTTEHLFPFAPQSPLSETPLISGPTSEGTMLSQAVWETNTSKGRKNLLAPGQASCLTTEDSEIHEVKTNSYYEWIRLLLEYHRMSRYLYAYQPIERPRQIRVLKLWPGSGQTQVRCDMTAVALDDNVQYEALSYTWGDQTVGTIITLDGLPMPVAKSLLDALLHLRLAEKPRILWIDALCINQLDNDEKSEQIQFMREVYERAEQVIVWLGLAADASDAAMDLVAGDVTAGSEDAMVPGTFEYLPSEDESDSDSDAQDLDTKRQAVTSSKRPLPVDDSQAAGRSSEELKVAWTGIFHLVQRPWWTRVWTIQEFAVAARGPVFQCGNKVVQAQELRRIVQLPPQARATAGSLDWETRVKIKASFNTLGVSLARETFQDTRGFNLELILTSTTLNCQATNPRDKVYGLLGLTSEPFRAAIVPNYSRSMTAIYTETSRSIININGRLDILSTNTASDRKTQPPLPSWVSDWFLRASRPSTLNKRGVYSACGLLAAQVNPASPPEVLDAGGFHVDTIASVTDPVGQGFAGTAASVRSVVRQLAEHLKQIIGRRVRAIPADRRYAMAHLRRSLQLDPDPCNSDAFWRTLCADRVGLDEFRSPAPAHFASLFELLFYPPNEILEADRTCFDQKNFTSVVIDWPRLAANHSSRAVPEHFMPGVADALRLEKYVEPLVVEIGQALGGRVFFVTQGGRMGIGPQGCKHGDRVAVLAGAHVPFVLRPERGWEAGIDADVRLMGEAYVHGIMRGEAVVDALNSTEIEGADCYSRFRIW